MDEDFIDFDSLGDSGDYQAYDDGGGGFDFTGDQFSFPTPSLSSLVGSGTPSYGLTPTMGAVPSAAGVAGAAMAGVMSLGARLAGMFGRGAGSAVINGVKFSMTRLWPYIRQYGPASVAAALGITVAQLGTLAMSAPQHPRRRRRGISSADIRRTKRVIRFNRQLSRSLGTGRSYSRGRSRGRHAHYFN